MIKIKLECWGTNSPSLNSRLIKQFVSEEDLLTYLFVDENPDSDNEIFSIFKNYIV